MMNILKGGRMKKSVALMLIGTVWLISIVSVRALSREVDINVDNNTISTRTFSNETNEILDQVGVKLGPDDSVNRRNEAGGTLTLDVKRAFDVNVLSGKEKIMLRKSVGTVKDVLDELKVSGKDRENLNYSESQELFPDIEIEVGKKIKITLNVDGKSKECLVPEGMVSDALDYLGVELSSNDLVEPEASSNVFDGMNLSVGRITYREVKKIEDIPFKSETKTSGLVNNGERQVARKGKPGSQEVFVRETLKNGEVIDSKVVNSNVISRPVNELILIGKSFAPKNEKTPKSTSHKANDNCSKGRCISGWATAYTSSKGAKTATGVTPVEGVTLAVNPKIIPYGSPVRVEADDGKVLFSGIAQDTGGALRKGSAAVDIYMSSTIKCMKFGRKSVKVYY